LRFSICFWVFYYVMQHADLLIKNVTQPDQGTCTLTDKTQ
jgi:hypothetical protein